MNQGKDLNVKVISTMEINVKKSDGSFIWTVTDDNGSVIEQNSAMTKEEAKKAAEMAMAWIKLRDIIY